MNLHISNFRQSVSSLSSNSRTHSSNCPYNLLFNHRHAIFTHFVRRHCSLVSRRSDMESRKEPSFLYTERDLASKNNKRRRCQFANIPSRPTVASAVHDLRFGKTCLPVFTREVSYTSVYSSERK